MFLPLDVMVVSWTAVKDECLLIGMDYKIFKVYSTEWIFLLTIILKKFYRTITNKLNSLNIGQSCFRFHCHCSSGFMRQNSS